MKQKAPEENRRMFDKIASSYDRANAVISLGRYKAWYRKLIKMSGIKSGDNVLDCATGTGNLPIEYKKMLGNDVRITGVDVAEKMMEIGREKAKKEGFDIHFEKQDILNMSFADNMFDAATITYGIRNTISIIGTLKEMARVVKPQGKVLILETGEIKGIRRFLYNLYQKLFVNKIGKMISGDNSAYRWLTDSSNNFPSGEQFLQIMKDCEVFSETSYKTFMFGMIFLYIGKVK